MTTAEMGTILPPTCGEECGLPGVPAVGCVATVTVRGVGVGFSYSVIASAQAVYLMGPHLDELWEGGRRQLLKRLLWRVPLTVEDENSISPRSDAVSSDSSEDETTAKTPVRARCFALTALHTPVDGVPDALFVLVAWTDEQGLQHLTLLVVPSLRRHLSLEDPAECLSVQNILPLRPSEGIFRLFHAAAFSTDPSKKVVVLATYPSPSAPAPQGRSTGPLGKSNTGDEEFEFPLTEPVSENNLNKIKEKKQSSLRYLVLEPAGTYVEGTKSLIRVNRAKEDTSWVLSEGEVADSVFVLREAKAEDIAPWLRRFKTTSVISSLTVQPSPPHPPPTDFVYCAIGTADGRVHLLRAEVDKQERRLSGPITDLIFVSTEPLPNPESSRIPSLEKYCTPNPQGHSSSTSLSHVALLVLDGIGHLLALLQVNSPRPLPQPVRDVSEVVRLQHQNREESPTLPVAEEREKDPLYTSRVSAPSPSDKPPELNSLRYFFHSSKGSKVVPEGKRSSRRSGGSAPSLEDPRKGYAGNILSRGLLCCAAVPYSGNHHPDRYAAEVIISTLGQTLVSVVFDDKNTETFIVSGFMVTPTPMYYVGFVDYFQDGTLWLLMASTRSVLVSRCVYNSAIICSRARQLIHLLEKEK